MLLEVVFVDGARENRLKPILKYCCCTRAFAKQSSSRISVVRCWLFLIRVLGETKFQHSNNKQQVHFWRYRSTCGIVHSLFLQRYNGKQTSELHDMHHFLSFCERSLAKQGSSRISVVRCCCFCLRSLAKQSPNIKTIRKRSTFLRYRSPYGDCPFMFFTTVQWNTDLGATRHALNLKQWLEERPIHTFRNRKKQSLILSYTVWKKRC